MKTISFFISVSLILSCEHKRNCIITFNELLDKYPNKVYVAYREKGHILGIADRGLDNNVRKGSYYFFENGNLQSYKFFQTDSAYSYYEDFDENGLPTSSSSKLFVDERIKEVNFDSAFLRLFFSALHRKATGIQIKINNDRPFELQFEDDSVFSNIEIASVGFSTRKMEDIQLIFEVKYQDLCSGDNKIFLDTFSLMKDPKIGLVKKRQL